MLCAATIFGRWVSCYPLYESSSRRQQYRRIIRRCTIETCILHFRTYPSFRLCVAGFISSLCHDRNGRKGTSTVESNRIESIRTETTSARGIDRTDSLHSLCFSLLFVPNHFALFVFETVYFPVAFCTMTTGALLPISSFLFHFTSLQYANALHTVLHHFFHFHSAMNIDHDALVCRRSRTLQATLPASIISPEYRKQILQ